MAKLHHISALFVCLWLVVPLNSQRIDNSEMCLLSSVVGPCEARIPRFFYDARIQRCALFYYGGCHGNANNFESNEECEYRCQQSDIISNVQEAQDACANSICPPGTTCVPEAEPCVFQPCVPYRCKSTGDAGAGNPCDSSPCKFGEKCVYNPLIQCKRAPCAQYVCQKSEQAEDLCASVQCAPGKICRPRQQQCFVPPCPQHECVDASSGGSSDQKTLEMCSQQPQAGACSATLRRWYFNRQTNQCEQYKTGMCRAQGNSNRFETKEGCETTCRDVPPCPPPPPMNQGCQLETQGLHPTTFCPIQRVVCDVSASCSSLSCPPGSACSVVNDRASCVVGGNKPTEDSKLSKCSPLPESGQCRMSVSRWYYNRKTSQCTQFSYGGCGGNLNRYNTKEQCERTCEGVPSCPMVKPASPPTDCKYEGEELNHDSCPVPKLVCDERNNCAFMNCPVDSPCQMVDGLARCVKKRRDDQQLAMCSQLSDAGSGLESLPRWSYSRLTNRCDQFIYRGQGGNVNRFSSKEECEQRCKGVDPCPMISVAALPPGCHHEAAELNKDLCPLPKLVCNRKPRECSTFDCAPNSICKVVGDRVECVPKEGENQKTETNNRLQVCSQLPERGSCRGVVPRWHYNRQTSRCETFIYGGCHGNENNFETQSSCEQVCHGIEQCPIASVSAPPVGCHYQDEVLTDGLCPIPKLVCNEDDACKVCLSRDLCKMTKTGAICVSPAIAFSSNSPLPDECKHPKDTGPCRALMSSFYFDNNTNMCQEFAYGGCEGNGNRFSSVKHCERVCVTKRPCIIPPMVPPPPGCDYEFSNDEEGCPTRHQLRCSDRVVIPN